MKGRLQCAPNEELKDSDCNKVIWILSSHVHLCMIICVDCTYLWWLIGEEMVVVFYFFCQIFGLLVLKVNLEFKFHHIFIPFKWQFHKISWIINKPHKAYNFYDKTKWDFLICRPDSTDLVLAVYQCPKTGSRREVVLQKQDGTSLYITRYLLLIIKGTC